VKLKSWTAGIAALTLAAAPTFAADSMAQWSYDQQVTPVGCCDSGCDCGDSCDCGSGCGGGGLLSGIGGGWLEGFSLAGTTGISAFDVGGWTQFGWTDDAVPLSAQGSNGTLGSFLDSPDRFNLHQQYFWLGKEADGSNGLDLGFRADFIYGVDAQKTQAFGNPGNEFDNNFDHGVYGWAIPQLYGEVAMNDLSVKIGHFYTLVGYETVTSPDNFFFSHSLTSFNSEPFTHTGVLGTYSGFENMTVYGGWTLGWDTGFTNANSGNSWIGGFSAPLGGDITLTYINTYGNFGLRGGAGQNDSYSHSIVIDAPLTDTVSYVFQSDMVDTDSVAGTVGNDQIGINQYLFYKYSDVLTFGSRVEWWKSDGVSNYAYTSGVNIQLLDNLVLRPESRQDWSPAAGTSFENIAVDMILTY